MTPDKHTTRNLNHMNINVITMSRWDRFRFFLSDLWHWWRR